MCTVESGTLAFIKDNKIMNYQECVSFTILVLYLDPHCKFVSKIKSADICKDWVRSLTKMSDQCLRFKLKKHNTGI